MFLSRIMTLALSAAMSLAFIMPASAQNAALSAAERTEIRSLIADYIKENPQAILDALETQARKDAERQLNEQARVEEIPDGFYDSPFAPSFGNNETPEVTVVEFFDYACGYCKRVVGDVNRLIDEEGNRVRVIFKELPILSADSETAARFALAAHKQGKYLELHTKFMEHYGGFNMRTIERMVEEIDGLDWDQLQEDAKSQDVDDALNANVQFARELGVRGTPFFLVGKRKLPGAAGYTRLMQMIEQEASGQEG